MPSLDSFVRYFEKFAPTSTAAEWDNVGLLLGDRDRVVERVLCCLTVTPAVVAEAVTENVDLIVTHHPVLFKAVKKLTSSSAEGRLLLPLLRAGVAIYSPHTAFDNCPGGINDGLARRCGLVNVRPLRLVDGRNHKYKLVVFVPDADLDRVSTAIFNAGGGNIGQYRECSFRVGGTGTFFASDSANPTVGEKGRREQVNEWRLEVVVPEDRLGEVARAMKSAHSYEEPAFDVYPMRSVTPSEGQGRLGELVDALTLREFAGRVKTALSASCLQFVGKSDRLVRTIAIACGAAGEFLSDAIDARADVFLTGEVRFHDCLSAEQAGIALVLSGHYSSERHAVEDLAVRLGVAFPHANVFASRAETDPLTAT